MEIKIIKYINLRKNLFKRFLMNFQLRKFPYRYCRTEGVIFDRNNMFHLSFIAQGFHDYVLNSSIFRQNGVVGCWIAHSKALEDISETDGLTVVLEDDFICRPNFFIEILKKINELEVSFDVLIIDPRGLGPLPEHEISQNVYFTNGVSGPYYVGSQCVFVNNKSISKLLKAKLKAKIKDVDGFYLEEKAIKALVIYTGLSKAIWLGSDITEKSRVRKKLKTFLDWISYTTIH